MAIEAGIAAVAEMGAGTAAAEIGGGFVAADMFGAGTAATLGGGELGGALGGAFAAGDASAMGLGSYGLADAGLGAASSASGLFSAGNANALFSGAKGLAGLAQASGLAGSNAAAQQAADPFASQRPYYQGQLAALMSNPNQVLPNTPGYQAGIDAVMRSGAAAGQLGSGNMQANLLQYGGNIYQQQEQILAQLSGANTGSPAAAGQIAQTGATNQANLVGQSLNSLASGAGTYYGSQKPAAANNPFNAPTVPTAASSATPDPLSSFD